MPDPLERLRREGKLTERGVNLAALADAKVSRAVLPGMEAAEPGSSFEMELPFPPSVNPYWRYFLLNGVIRHALSSTGKDYRAETIFAIKKALGKVRPLTGPLSLTLVLFPPNLARMDLDNRIKPLLDAMGAAKVYGDDSQIRAIHARFGPLCRPNGKVAVRIVPLSVETALGMVDDRDRRIAELEAELDRLRGEA